MGVRLIRQNSDTPTVTNTDDARMVRYAYGGYSGYVKGAGSELSHEISGNYFIINSGIINVQGWEVEIDSDGWRQRIMSAGASRRYFCVYCQVNLATGVADIRATYSTSPDNPMLPSVNDDLTINTDGSAYIELYRFSELSGTISDVEKRITEIPYLYKTMLDENKKLENRIKSGDLIPAKSKNSEEINGIKLVSTNGRLQAPNGTIAQRKTIFQSGSFHIDTPSSYQVGYSEATGVIPSGGKVFRSNRTYEIVCSEYIRGKNTVTEKEVHYIKTKTASKINTSESPNTTVYLCSSFVRVDSRDKSWMFKIELSAKGNIDLNTGVYMPLGDKISVRIYVCVPPGAYGSIDETIVYIESITEVTE